MGARRTIEACENAFRNSKVVGPIRRIQSNAPGGRGVPPLGVIDFITLESAMSRGKTATPRAG